METETIIAIVVITLGIPLLWITRPKMMRNIKDAKGVAVITNPNNPAYWKQVDLDGEQLLPAAPDYQVSGGEVWDMGTTISMRTMGKHGAVKKVRISSTEKREFSIGMMIVWAILFVIGGTLALGPLGAMIGFVAAIAVSFGNVRTYTARVKYKGGDRVEVAGTQVAISRLSRMRGR